MTELASKERRAESLFQETVELAAAIGVGNAKLVYLTALTDEYRGAVRGLVNRVPMPAGESRLAQRLASELQVPQGWQDEYSETSDRLAALQDRLSRAQEELWRLERRA